MLRTMLLLLAFLLLGLTLAEEEEKCPGEPSKVEPTANLYTSTLTQGVFWFSLVYILLFWAFGGFLRSQWTKDTTFYCPEEEHIEGLCGLRGSGAGFRIPFPLFPRKVPIVDVYKTMFWNASLIVLAMLWSSFFNSAFAAIYYKAKGGGELESEDCPERVGTYGCTYAGEEESNEWAVVIPAFVTALVTVVLLLYVMAKCTGKFWVEFVTGICGHLIGFRWLEGIIWKMYGTLEFFDMYAQNGFTGRPWVVYPDDAPEGTTVGSAYNWITLWSASSADNFKSMLGGASPELLPVAGDFVGTLNNSTFTKLLNNYAEEHHIESVIGGIGENPETENPWCFFVEARTRFVCYVGESFQDSMPLFWFDGDSYSNELGQRMWKMCAYGAICMVLLFSLRYVHETFLESLFSKETEDDEDPQSSEYLEEVRQLEEDCEEFDEAIEDVVNDAAGNATGWVCANFCIWVVIGVAKLLQPYHDNIQYGTTNPFILLVLGWAMSVVLCTFFTKLETWNRRREESQQKAEKKLKTLLKHAEQRGVVADPERVAKYEKSKASKFDKCMDKYSKGFLPTCLAWMLGYLVYNLLQLVVFIAARSPVELDRMRCATGFTAYTPNYPGGQNMQEIFAPTPFSPFGIAILVTAAFLTKLSVALYKMENRIKNKTLMTQLHGLIIENRKVQKKIKMFKTAEIRESRQRQILENRAQGEVHIRENDVVDHAILELQQQDNNHMEIIIAQLSEEEKELKVHQRLVSSRIKANLFMEMYCQNEGDYYAIVIGLSFETVIDAMTEYWSSCEFSHDSGSPEYESCMKDSPLEVAQRVMLADFLAAAGFMLVIVGSILMLEYFGLNVGHEAKHHTGADTDSTSEDETIKHRMYHQESVAAHRRHKERQAVRRELSLTSPVSPLPPQSDLDSEISEALLSNVQKDC